MSGQLVVIACGATKRGERAPAAELYAGSYFRSCLASALSIAPRSSVLILSALHGLVELDRELDPYDMILGIPGAITAADVGRQAAELGVAGLPVLALCPARYADVLEASGAFPEVSRPLAGLGIGQQRGRLRELRLQAAAW